MSVRQPRSTAANRPEVHRLRRRPLTRGPRPHHETEAPAPEQRGRTPPRPSAAPTAPSQHRQNPWLVANAHRLVLEEEALASTLLGVTSGLSPMPSSGKLPSGRLYLPSG